MGTKNYRATCYVHVERTFPVRADKQDASEDKNSHGHAPGSHHLDILEVDLSPTEIGGFPPAGYSQEIPEMCDRAIRAMMQLPPEVLYGAEDETDQDNDIQ